MPQLPKNPDDISSLPPRPFSTPKTSPPASFRLARYLKGALAASGLAATLGIAEAGCSIDGTYFSLRVGATPDGKLVRLKSGDQYGGIVVVHDDGTFTVPELRRNKDEGPTCKKERVENGWKYTVGEGCTCNVATKTCTDDPKTEDQQCEFTTEDEKSAVVYDPIILNPYGNPCTLRRYENGSMKFPERVKDKTLAVTCGMAEGADYSTLYMSEENCACICDKGNDCICQVGLYAPSTEDPK